MPIVPNIKNLTIQVAHDTLVNVGLNPSNITGVHFVFSNPHTVYSQSLPAGSNVAAGALVNIVANEVLGDDVTPDMVVWGT
jgi:beta-lactam-binding protein with PASTA domain